MTMTKGSDILSLFKGAATALITPFKDGKIDYVAMGKLVEWQIGQGINALAVCGTTGEASTLSTVEKVQLARFVIDLTDGRVPVLAGTGSNSTKLTTELSKEMEDAGADGLLIVTPYYNKCSEYGLIAHYENIADSVGRSRAVSASEHRRYKRGLRRYLPDMPDGVLHRRRVRYIFGQR